MASFDPSAEQGMLIEAAARVATEKFRPTGAAAEEAGGHAPAALASGWSLGLLTAAMPVEVGGLGERSALSGVLAAEELAFGDLSAALATLAPASFALPIQWNGTEPQRRTYLPRFTGQARPPLSTAVIEPSFDFDLRTPRTRAVASGRGYLVSGEKAWVPLADEAEELLIFALEGESVQAFLAPRTASGVTIQGKERLLGLGGVPLFRVQLNEVPLGTEARLGGEAGLDFEPVLASTRVATASLGVGLARAAFEYALAYAKDRQAFGGPIAQKQSIAFMLAEIATEIEAIRLLVWEAAWLIDQGSPAQQPAHLAHLGSSDLAMMATDRAVQILGGHGYIRDHPVERWLREARSIASLCGLAMV